MTDNLDELLRRAREHGNGDLNTDEWIEATEALTPQENP
jgi:hypothetical protein